MTRQKKEILKKINEIENFVQADMELGCGFAPADFYNPLYDQIYKLQEKLAELSHYSNVDEMFYDTRYEEACVAKGVIPFGWA